MLSTRMGTNSSVLYLCSKAAGCKAGMVCAVPTPTHVAALEQGWKKHTTAVIYVPRSSHSGQQVAMPGAEMWPQQEREGKLCPQGVLQHFGLGHEHYDQALFHPSSVPEPTCSLWRPVPTLSEPDLKPREINRTFNFKRL